MIKAHKVEIIGIIICLMALNIMTGALVKHNQDQIQHLKETMK